MAYRDDDIHHTSAGFVMGLLTGALIGVGIGLLLAPKPGAELRSDVRAAMDRGAEAFRRATAGDPTPSEDEGDT